MWYFLATLAGIGFVFAGLFFLFNILKWAFGDMIKSFGVVVSETFRYITHVIPGKRSGRFERMKREQEETAALERAAIERRLALRTQKEIDTLVKAALKSAIFHQNKYPYVNDKLIYRYILSFSTATVLRMKEIEQEIKENHLLNKTKYEKQSPKTYTLKDVENQQPIDQNFEYPFEMRLFMFGLDYVLHIRDLIEKSDVLVQSQDRDKVLDYMMSLEERFERLRRNSGINIKSRI